MYHLNINILKLIKIALIFVLIPFELNAQVKNLGLPYIINYSADDYHANKQNWAVAEDSRGVIYFGNTQGVLEFDGQNWRLISLPNIVRSLAYGENGRIYVGSRGDFGYLIPDSVGAMKYVSLLDKIDKKEDRKFSDDINRIFITNGKVYFSCEGLIFEYGSGKIKVIKIPKLKQTIAVNDKIFVRLEGENEGLCEYSEGKTRQIEGGIISKDLSVKAILPYEGKLLIVTVSDGLFIYDNKIIEKFKTDIDDFLKKEKILSAILLKDGNYALGLFSSGLLIIDKSGNIIQHLNLSTGVQNNTINNLLQDSEGNIWLCTSNGITYVLSSLPLSLYSSIYGLNNAIYSAFLLEERLYIASADGLFYKNWEGVEKHLNTIEQYSPLGEKMSILSLDTINETLLAATNLGIYTIKENKVSELQIPDRISVWKFLRLHGNRNLILAGTNKGFLQLEYIQAGKTSAKIKAKPLYKAKSKHTDQKLQGKWKFKSIVKGFNERCRHVEIDKSNHLWFSDKVKGVAQVIPVNNFDSVTTVWYNENKGLPKDEEMYVFIIKDEVIISSRAGIYSYNKDKDVFLENDYWNKLIGKGILISQLEIDIQGNIWLKQQRKDKQTNEEIFEMAQLLLQKDGSYQLYKTPYYKFKNNIQCISPLSDGNLIIGTDKGFIHFDPKIKKDYNRKYNALIRKVEFVANDSLIFDGAFANDSGYVSMVQKDSEKFRIPFRYNNLRFTFTAPYFDAPDQIQFKYYLEGNDEGWSDWKTKNFKEYSNLPPGNYTFHIISKNVYEIESQEAVYQFTILPPWYRTIWAYISYVILIILLIWGIVRLSVRRLRLQKEYLEKVVEERTAEIRMKNVELEQQKEEILAQKEEIEFQKDKIEEKNKNITASITYAKRIQEAMLPLREKIDQAFDDYFILFKPRDIVSGDFYWFSTKNNKIIFTAVDCTGHGVPGAFMSMIGSEILTTIVNQGITVPSEILDYMNRYVRKALKQDQTENQDGMDMSLCTIDKQSKIVEWAGAKNPMVYIQNNELFHLKGDMQSIGGHQLSKKERQFTNYEVSYASGPTYFYIFSDGYQDQFGGGKARKFMVKSMKDMFFENYQKPMSEQLKIYDAVIEEWKKNAEQTDDILVIGFKLTP